jgi:hypothetical protein
MDYTTKLFYNGYFHEYFKIRMLTLRHFLQHEEEYINFLSNNNDLEREKIINSLKLEIRGTYFHAIETLFELIFAVEGNNDENIWHRLASADFRKNYERIKTFATDNVSSFNVNIQMDGVEIPFCYQLFYSGMEFNSDQNTSTNMKFIENFILAVAKDFSERDDYNAYKHGLRLFPTFVGFQAWNQYAAMNLDFSNSYAIMKKEDPYKTHIIPFDPQRDLRMIGICSQLISNIILSRRARFNGEDQASLYYFYNEDFDNITRSNVTVGKTTFSISPVVKG